MVLNMANLPKLSLNHSALKPQCEFFSYLKNKGSVFPRFLDIS